MQTLDKLKRFTDRLHDDKVTVMDTVTTASSSGRETESYHGQVMEQSSDEEEDLSEWSKGKLKFRKHVDDHYRIPSAVQARLDDNYVVIDARADNSAK